MPLADDVTANAGAGGATFRTLSDGTREHPTNVVEYVTGGSAGAWTLQAADATHGLPTNIVQVGGSAATLIAPGQAAMAASVPVVLASDQSDVPVNLKPQTTGGCSVYSTISSGAANQDSYVVKASAGQLYGYALFNTTASARFVKLYNKATAPTSADTPVLRIYVPPLGGANVPMGGVGAAFSLGLALRITTGAGDSDTGSCSANDVLANCWYK